MRYQQPGLGDVQLLPTTLGQMVSSAFAEPDVRMLVEGFSARCAELFDAISITVFFEQDGTLELMFAMCPLRLEPGDRRSPGLNTARYATQSFALRFGGFSIGRLDVVFEEARSSEADVQLGEALADVLAAAIVRSTAAGTSVVANDRLQIALARRASIEQARGIVAARHHVDLDEALLVLRRHSRATHRRLSDVAKAVVDGTVELAPGGAPGP